MMLGKKEKPLFRLGSVDLDSLEFLTDVIIHQKFAQTPTFQQKLNDSTFCTCNPRCECDHYCPDDDSWKCGCEDYVPCSCDYDCSCDEYCSRDVGCTCDAFGAD